MRQAPRTSSRQRCWLQDMAERNQPGTYAYFFAEPEQAGPAFFTGLPPEGFSGARPKSPHKAQATDRMTVQLQVLRPQCALTAVVPGSSRGAERGRIGMQALRDIFSDHEQFMMGQLQPFFETSSSLAQAPAWGIVDSAFLRHLMSTIKRRVIHPGAAGLVWLVRQSGKGQWSGAGGRHWTTAGEPSGRSSSGSATT